MAVDTLIVVGVQLPTGEDGDFVDALKLWKFSTNDQSGQMILFPESIGNSIKHQRYGGLSSTNVPRFCPSCITLVSNVLSLC